MIQLGTPLTQTGIPGMSLLNAPDAAVVSIMLVGPSVLRCIFSFGTGTVVEGKTTGFTAASAGNSFAALIFDALASTWTWTLTGQNGTLTPAQLAAVQAVLNSIVAPANLNAAEQFANSLGLLGSGCTDIPW